MARRKGSKNSAGPEALLTLPIIAIVAVWNYLKENIWLAILIGAAIIAIVVGIVVAKKRKRAAYLRWYYDRDRRLAELNANEHIDQTLTSTILLASENQQTVQIGNPDEAFDSAKEAYRLTLQSSEIVQADDAISANNDGRALQLYKIASLVEPLTIRYTGENNGGYVFYVFPQIVLAFVEGPEQIVFIAAYKPEALSIVCSPASKRVSMIVHEKTQNAIRYYDRFNPVRDAEIISSKWEVTNKDGSRSFKGGLLPEHNPLIFLLKYGKVTVKLGDYAVSTAFSRYKPAMLFSATYDKLKEQSTTPRADTAKSEPVESNSNPVETSAPVNTYSNEKVQRDIFTSVTAPKSDTPTEAPDLAPIFTATGVAAPISVAITEPAKQPEAVPNGVIMSQPCEHDTCNKTAKSITVDDARYRNRLVVNQIIQEMNTAYSGSYEFKLYQVRKDRQDRAMQDAGIYTYVTADTIRYTVELNIRTSLNDGATTLEFYIWSDKAQDVQKRFSNLIEKKDMRLKATGYSSMLSIDYQNDNRDIMAENMGSKVKELFAALIASL